MFFLIILFPEKKYFFRIILYLIIYLLIIFKKEIILVCFSVFSHSGSKIVITPQTYIVNCICSTEHNPFSQKSYLSFFHRFIFPPDLKIGRIMSLIYIIMILCLEISLWYANMWWAHARGLVKNCIRLTWNRPSTNTVGIQIIVIKIINDN